MSGLRRPAVLSARVIVALVLAAAAGLAGLLARTPAASAAVTVYAAASPVGTASCLDPADACSLSSALGSAYPGGVVQLVTPGSSARYVGNWAVSTNAIYPMTIEPLPGLSSAPVLDGGGPDAPAGETCSTDSCDGPVLTVPAGVDVALTGITIADGNNTSNGTGGGLDNAGTVTITGSTFTGNTANLGGAIDSGDNVGGGAGTGTVTVTRSAFSGNTAVLGGAIDSGNEGGGSVTVTASTFTGNSASTNGGAIDSGDDGGGGSVTVTASAFTGNSARDHGGAIDSGGAGGGGSVTVSASTFSGNTASEDGGAIDSGDSSGGGSVTVSASTFSGNSASTDGGAIDSGDNDGGGSVTVSASTFAGNSAFYDGEAINSGGAATVAVAADVFAGSCDQGRGTWDDAGYNAGSDGSCLAGGPGDVDAGSVAALGLGALAANGGPTQTIMPQPGSPETGIIPNETVVSMPGGQLLLCPDYDQRGYYVSAPGPCDAGAVQTTGQAPVKLADSTTSTGFYQAGDQIGYRYKVTNTDNTTLFGITIDDPAVPGAACPRSSLAPGKAETCTGSYTVTAADVAAGKVTDTATATATTVSGDIVLSSPATVTVLGQWPASVQGFSRTASGSPEGYYLGVMDSTWSLWVSHPGTGKVAFTGKITIDAGKITGVTPFAPGDRTQVKGKTLTFTITSYGKVDGFKFTAKTAASITFTLKVNGKAATARQIYLGFSATPSTSPSPLTFTR
jgi:predicted outer membrane repeat protein